MPEHAMLNSIRKKSIALLGSYIESLPGAKELESSRVEGYADRGFIFGWAVPIAFDDGIRNFFVLLEHSFPFTAPRIALDGPQQFLLWPHVEWDGVLCILGSNSSVSSSDPVGVVQHLLAQAVKLVEASLAGANAADFETEFNTYWHHKATDGSNRCRSLVTLDSRNRIISLWRGRSYDIIADDEPSIRNWLAHRYPTTDHGSDNIGRAALIW